MAALDTRRLTRRVTIEQRILTDDDVGGQSVSWRTIGFDYVAAVPVAGKEGLENGTLRSAMPYRVAMRFRQLDEASYRFRADWLPGKVLNIQSVADPDGRRRELVLFCEAVPI